jgi:RNA polymerase sigma-70 factor (ECF subfamily)
MAQEHDTLTQQLADTRWVAALARRLCADAATADDLAQEAWLRALEVRRAPAVGPSESPRARAWFLRVVLNFARQRARGDARRRARERHAARPEAHPEDDLVARAEASTRLVAHVLTLDEPYRQVILARYFDGLEPDELARRTGVNPSTVRTRLERGLALLRVRLERDGGPSWLAAFAPLALGPFPVSPLIPVATATAALPLFVGVAMALTAKLVLAVAALGVGLYFVWPEREPASDAPLARSDVPADEGVPRALSRQSPPSGARSEAAPTANDAPRPPSSDTAAAGPALDLDAEREAEVPPGAIEGLVVRGTIPLDGGHVDFQAGYHVRLPSERTARLAQVADGTLTRIAIGSDGRFSLADLAAGWYTVGVDTTETRNLPRGAHAGPGVQFDVEVFADRPSQRLVIVLGAASIIGHVYDDEGQPVAGAVVKLGRSGSYLERLGSSFAETDATGSFAFHDLLPEVYGISLASLPGQDHVDYVWQQLERLGLEETRVFDLGTPWRAVVWRGRVVHPDGAPVERGGTLGRESDATGSYEEVAVTTLASFTLRVRPGRYVIRVRVSTSDSGFRTDYLTLGEVDVPDTDFEHDLALPGTTVRGNVTGVALEDLPKRLDLSLYPQGSQQPVQHASVTRDGRFVLYAVPPGEYRVDLWPALTAAPGTSLVVREGDRVLTLDAPASQR